MCGPLSGSVEPLQLLGDAAQPQVHWPPGQEPSGEEEGPQPGEPARSLDLVRAGGPPGTGHVPRHPARRGAPGRATGALRRASARRRLPAGRQRRRCRSHALLSQQRDCPVRRTEKCGGLIRAPGREPGRWETARPAVLRRVLTIEAPIALPCSELPSALTR